MSTSPRWSRSSTIIPAQVPSTGPWKARTASSSPYRRMRRMKVVELIGLADLHGLGPQPAQHGSVLAEVPLQGEDADTKRLHNQIVARASRVPGRPRLTGGRAALCRRLAALAAGCVTRDAWPYIEVLSPRRGLASFASAAPGTRGYSGGAVSTA